MAARVTLLRTRPFALPLAKRTARLLLVTACAAVLALLLIYLGRGQILPDEDGRAASVQMHAAMRELANMRAELGYAVDSRLDPASSGLIGVEYTDLTTTLGDIRAKQTALNPQFAGLLVMWLKQAGLQAGDKVALSFTGSFPALNLAAVCACEALGLETLIFSSVGASTYGANLPGFTWLDMEKRLFDRAFIQSRTRYASLGGIVDTRGGIDETGFELGEAAIARHGAEYIREGGPRDVTAAVERRLALYAEGGMPKAYINVGGNITALGWVSEAALLDNGLLARVPHTSSPQRGLLFRFFEAGVPVIHMINIERLAAANYLPIAPTVLDAEMDLTQPRRAHFIALAALLLCWLGGCALLVRRETR